MRLTKSTSHAIRILIDCARADDRLVKVAELSERLQITQQNVFKIVNLLARAGLIEAMRGRNGGVRLARPAKRHPHRRRRARHRGHARRDRGRIGGTPAAAGPRREPDPRRRARAPSSTCSTSTRWPTWRRRSPRRPHAASQQPPHARDHGQLPLAPRPPRRLLSIAERRCQRLRVRAVALCAGECPATSSVAARCRTRTFRHGNGQFLF